MYSIIEYGLISSDNYVEQEERIPDDMMYSITEYGLISSDNYVEQEERIPDASSDS